MIAMDKINNVSFTGIRNIAGMEFSRKAPTVSKSLSMVLRDDFDGKDLTEFRNVIKKLLIRLQNLIMKFLLKYLI